MNREYKIEYRSCSEALEPIIVEMENNNWYLEKVSIVIKDGIQQNELLFSREKNIKQILLD